MNIRKTSKVIEEIKELVSSKGYIYALCLIIMEDFHFDITQMHSVNYWNKLNRNEINLILGFLIQKPIDLEKPSTPFDLIKLKERTISLMNELHKSTNLPFIEKFKQIDLDLSSENQPNKVEFFGGENSFIEPIFYAGDGIYDFQFLEHLENKYKYDKEWLIINKNFRFDEVVNIVLKIKEIHSLKIKKVNFYDLKENKDQIIKDFKKNKIIPKKILNENLNSYITFLEFYQYLELFKNKEQNDLNVTDEDILNNGWNSFYEGLLDLFCISPNDFDDKKSLSDFLLNFSIYPNEQILNKDFNSIGDFNIVTARPIIQLVNKNYFVPVIFSVFETIYESPFYWMMEDKNYKNQLSYNRGKVGEEIAFDLLKNVFGEDNIYPSIRIVSKKGYDDTDIDVLCILGNKALCVQVKSKKLTQLSRKGDFDQLKIDFKGAIQDAYEQGLICRERILEKTATFYDSKGNKIEFNEEINEVYILGITTENYPTLTHQTSILLEKNIDSPYPLFLTIFDLELVLFYLDNPYDFLYYVRQRINLMDYVNANEEMHYLGYHLMYKLWKDHKADFIYIDNSLGQLIDQNYYPFKLGIDLPSKIDKLKSRWKNKDFEILCKQISELNSPKVTDIIFHLLDWGNDSIDNLINYIKQVKIMTNNDNSWHNFTLMAGPERSTFGLTYISSESNNVDELKEKLVWLSRGRKYKSKADYWIGLGSLKNSSRFVDCLVYNDTKWHYNEKLENEVKTMFSTKPSYIKLGKKIGRNDKCPCGSNKKYKFCCGRSN